MMYALVHYPHIDIRRIQQFREIHDPQYSLILPHITLMFPVPEAVGETNLVHHLDGVLHSWRPFPIHLQDVQISADLYLYLLVQAGKEVVIRLHDEIYTGILGGYLRKEIPYIPHVTLGITGSRAHLLEEARQLNINATCLVDQLHLLKVNDERSSIVWEKTFLLV